MDLNALPENTRQAVQHSCVSRLLRDCSVGQLACNHQRAVFAEEIWLNGSRKDQFGEAETHMRQQISFGFRYRLQERSFFTEAQILKFSKPRAKEDLTCSVRNGPDSTNEKADELITTTPSEPLAFAQRGRA
jgi:hypothetical protein